MFVKDCVNGRLILCGSPLFDEELCLSILLKKCAAYVGMLYTVKKLGISALQGTFLQKYHSAILSSIERENCGCLGQNR